mmetsp:Transcript_54927/g.141442  ORF Transcript_54927/g.141442 Transcript_54927/m.141442 type:complete len:229 (+) Transcript_54927:111-797(+)
MMQEDGPVFCVSMVKRQGQLSKDCKVLLKHALGLLAANTMLAVARRYYSEVLTLCAFTGVVLVVVGISWLCTNATRTRCRGCTPRSQKLAGARPRSILCTKLGQFKQDECPICFDSLAREPRPQGCLPCALSDALHFKAAPCAELLQLPCQHVFHGSCGESWLERQLVCPICRAQVPSLDGCVRLSVSRAPAGAVSSYSGPVDLWQMLASPRPTTGRCKESEFDFELP